MKDPHADLISAEREVDSAHLHQLVVCALLDDNALVKAGDLVRVPNRRHLPSAPRRIGLSG